MNLYRKLSKRPYIFLQVTGVNLIQFASIIRKLRPIWRKKHLKNKKIEGRPYGIGSLENQLLCLLLYYRTYTTQLFIGFWFRVDDSTVCRGIKRLEPFLAQVIEISKEPKMSEQILETLLLDATEQRIRRPQEGERNYYSGKKKCHTVKTEMIMKKKGKIVQISKPFPGRVHDITMRRGSDKIPPARSVYVDGGYQGLKEEQPNVKLPIRKPRGKPHTEEAKKHNRSHKAIRNPVECKFREIKIFKILSHIYRNSRSSYGVKWMIIAGIVNLKNGF